MLLRGAAIGGNVAIWLAIFTEVDYHVVPCDTSHKDSMRGGR